MELKVDEKLIQKVADLARLELTSQEIATYTDQFQKILGYFEQIDEVRVDGVTPLINPVEQVSVLRDDQVVAFPLTEEGSPKILQSSSEVVYDGFKVPPIL